MLDSNGKLTEGTISNVFFYRDTYSAPHLLIAGFLMA